MDPRERAERERGLWSAVRASDERAWQILYDESFDGLHAYALWRCAGLRDLAEEVVQDTWLTAVRRIRAFDPERGSFADWLRGIAANVVRNRLRQARRQRSKSRTLNPRDPVGHIPEMDAERREQAECIARALSTLPEHYEAVLRAKYLERQSMADIAATVHATTKAVESLLTRARQAFREAYLSQEESDGLTGTM